MTSSTHADEPLFRRDPDEYATDLQTLWDHCRGQKELGHDRRQLPETIRPVAREGQLMLELGGEDGRRLNHWSFSQLCRLAGVSKNTINRLSPATAARALRETLPYGRGPTQVLTDGDLVRSIHGTNYVRLWNADLLKAVSDCAAGYEPARPDYSGGTGLSAGEQDMFCFLIDPEGWVEVEDEMFAPGLFVWNSEVGGRGLGVSTFWFQRRCANRLLWDEGGLAGVASEHTDKVGDALDPVRRRIESLTRRRDERRDAFVRVALRAMKETLGAEARDVVALLQRSGVPGGLGKRAIELARARGLTIFAVVEALTRLTPEIPYAGERTDADRAAARLLQLAS